MITVERVRASVMWGRRAVRIEEAIGGDIVWPLEFWVESRSMREREVVIKVVKPGVERQDWR